RAKPVVRRRDVREGDAVVEVVGRPGHRLRADVRRAPDLGDVLRCVEGVLGDVLNLNLGWRAREEPAQPHLDLRAVVQLQRGGGGCPGDERFGGSLSQQETARAAGDRALRYRHDLVAVEHLTAAPHVVYNHLVHEQGIAAWRRAGTDPVARHDDGQRQRLWGALKYTLRIDGCVSRG